MKTRTCRARLTHAVEGAVEGERGEYGINATGGRAQVLGEPSLAALRRGILGRAILAIGFLSLISMSVIPAFASLTLPSTTANVVPLDELQLPSLQFPTFAVPSMPSKQAAHTPTRNRVKSTASAPVARTLPSTQSTAPAQVAVVDNTYRLVPAPKPAPDPAKDPFAKVPVVTEVAAPIGVLPESAATPPPPSTGTAGATPTAPTYEPEAPATTPPAEETPPVRMLASAAAADEETPSTSAAEEPAAPAEPEVSSSEPAAPSAEPDITSSSDTAIAATTSTTIASSSSEPAAGTTSAAISTMGGPQLVVNAASIDFGSVEPMSSSTVLVEIENVGDAELTITAVTVSGPDGVFTVATGCAVDAGAGREGDDRSVDDADRSWPSCRNALVLEQRSGR